MRELGWKVCHDDVDFFCNVFGDIIVTNPPFSKLESIFFRLRDLDKPFVLIIPPSKIYNQYLRRCYVGVMDRLQLIIPFAWKAMD